MLILCIAFGIALLDQVSKQLVRAHYALFDGTTVIPSIFDLRYIQNTGAAWGMLQGFNGWLIAMGVLALILIFRFRHVFIAHRLLDRSALGLMAGGIVGNLVDRLRLGYVVDFLDFYWRGHHFPAFNVADAAICVGVFLYMICQFTAVAEQPKDAPAQSAGPRDPSEPAQASTEPSP